MGDQHLPPFGPNWWPKPGAVESSISALCEVLPFETPAGYLELLRSSNGGEGELAIEPWWFQLYDIEDVISCWRLPELREYFPTFFFFGSNGGLESYAFDMSASAPWPVVAIDQIAGAESAMLVSTDLQSFLAAVGYPSEDEPSSS